ncbi:MAG: PVC-type heme-binding CxxCH protein [Fimbriiglobus sp.]
MPRRLLAALLALTAAALLPAADAPPAPVPLKDAAARFKVPEGFRVTLFAGEPDVVQPIAMTFDDRGRMWVVECRSYPKWRADGKGTDRVVILEDTDGDGVHDKRTVFLEDGSNLSGIELGFGGVWLCSLPNLIFIPIKAGGDKPAGPPQILLDGWNLKETKHNVFNSLGWGPDGWLYGLNGIQAKSYVGKPGTPQDKRKFFDCGVWRYHPTRHTFEVYAYGTTNPFGMDWDENGQMVFTNCVIDHLWHVVPGAHYQRMYGQDPNPYVYEPMRSASDHKHWAGGAWTSSRGTTAGVSAEHSDAGGGHAHSGAAVYLGDNFPAEYRNSVFMCNIHGNRLNRDKLSIQGSGLVGTHAPDFAFANDPWFRGICVKLGPDGAMYVSDWSDTGECHNYNVVDASNGRIYRISYGSPKPWKLDLSKLTDSQLAKFQSSGNEWAVRRTRLKLYEMASMGINFDSSVKYLYNMVTGFMRWPDAKTRLRAWWALYAIGAAKPDDLLDLAKDVGAGTSTSSDADSIRVWAVQLLVDVQPVSAVVSERLVEHALRERSPFVRMALASAMQRLPDDAKLKLADALFNRPEDNADHNLSVMYWLGIQPAVLTKPVEALALAGRTKNAKVRESIVRCYLTRPGVELPAALADVVKLLGDVTDDSARKGIIAGVRLATAGRRDLTPPAGWAHTYAKLLASPDPGTRNDAEALAVAFGDEKALAALRTKLLDASKPADVRRTALALLVTRKPADLGPVLCDLLADPAVRGAAVRGLASYPDADTPAAILKAYPAFSAEEKADAVQTLAGRPAFALALLDAVQKGAVPKADVTAFTARQILALNDKTVAAKLETAWGVVRPASATRKDQAAKLKKLLTDDALKSADVARGRAVWTKSCASCHKLFGEGGDVGPELTGSQRTNLDYVLENVLDPSAVVPGEYRMTTFQLADGRTLSGIIRKETPQAVTVRTLNEEVIVPVADIDTRKPTPLSIMPDGLFDTLKDDELRDLVAYLRATAQVPLPAGGK